jgi:uncharacterized membrane-anchored protein
VALFEPQKETFMEKLIWLNILFGFSYALIGSNMLYSKISFATQQNLYLIMSAIAVWAAIYNYIKGREIGFEEAKGRHSNIDSHNKIQ